jgi:hypothetical protein
MLDRLGFSDEAEAYLMMDCGIDSMQKGGHFDGDDYVENTIKGVTSPRGTVLVGNGRSAVKSRNNGIPVSIRAVSNLKLCVTNIDLELMHGYRDQQRYEENLRKTVVESVINEKDWPHLENIQEYLASQYGGTGATLGYIFRAETTLKPEADDLAEDYDTVDQNRTARAPYSGRAFVNDRRKVWDIMSNMCGKDS